MHMPMMGRTWSVEAGWDIYAMSDYHTVANFSESPLDENILWVGTDDGLIQVTTDGGKTWKKIDLGKIKGVPATAYVNDIRADLYDPNTVYVALDNHKYGDFKPYLIKSTNLGKKWTSLAKSLPEKHLVWRIVQDHVNKDLMFIGTEFGLFFTVDGGKKWLELDGGIPTISTRDVKIQRRENDLVVGTFGRGIYILDDYAPLRELTKKSMKKDAILIAPSRPVKWFRLDDNHSDSDGSDLFAAKNPAHGATLTYFLKDSLLTAKEKRQAAEKEMIKDEKYPKYPAWEDIEAENQEAKPAVYIEIKDRSGKFVNRIKGKTSKGLHRITWDMTLAKSSAITGEEKSPYHPLANGVMAAPGHYTATLYKRIGSTITQLAAPVQLELKAIYENSLAASMPSETLKFDKSIADAEKRTSAINMLLKQMTKTVKDIRTALDHTPGNITQLETQFANIRTEINAINIELGGLTSRNQMGAKPANISSRLGYAMSAVQSSYGPTKQHREQLAYALEGLDMVSKRVKALQEAAIPKLQQAIAEASGPWTTGSIIITQ